ncbi:MAG: PA2169 family four-helix-bundle protein [Bacteroidota bacterium]
METNEVLVKLVNDLIGINNDRVEGYEKAAVELKNQDVALQALFRSMANDSKLYARELKALIIDLNGQSSDTPTQKGRVYRAWMDVISNFGGNNRQAILDSCEYGEEEAQQAYTAVLKTGAEMDINMKGLIANQQLSLKTAHALIKNFQQARQPVVAW